MHEEQCPIPPSSRKTANGHLGGGGGDLSNGHFCGRSGIFVLKLKNNKCRNKMQKAVCIQTLSTP